MSEKELYNEKIYLHDLRKDKPNEDINTPITHQYPKRRHRL